MKIYVSALREEGHNINLCFKDQTNPRTDNISKRKRNIIWFNPPFNIHVKTNIGKMFSSLLIIYHCCPYNTRPSWRVSLLRGHPEPGPYSFDKCCQHQSPTDTSRITYAAILWNYIPGSSTAQVWALALIEQKKKKRKEHICISVSLYLQDSFIAMDLVESCVIVWNSDAYDAFLWVLL